MDTSMLVVSASISGAIGIFAPFLIPLIYKVVEKIKKGSLEKNEKRLIVTLLSVLVAAGMIVVNFEWVGSFKEDAYRLAEFFFVNFAIVKGTIQTIYELIIQEVPAIDKAMDRLGS